ncbi:MAG: ABC transporter ATP-binding protein [Clostridiales bacterium]|nr:ABC transporter ATP-binding protein [Clostridiales bacterium]
MISLENIDKHYKMGNNIVKALDNVSLMVEKGEFIAVIGQSGSGKSTLMNIIGCLDTPTCGKYLLENCMINCVKDNEISEIRNKKIGFVFQGFNLIPTLTAFENVELTLIYRKMNKHKRQKLVEQALSSVGLTSRMFHKPHELSGGQQQRVAIARAIVGSPSIILADEPCGNLDSNSGAEIMEIFHQLNKKGNTIILITHDNNSAKTADRILVMRDGKLHESCMA